ncbi:hypothetical protein ACX6XY_20460 [Streptomyces sp. O3]
MFLSLPAYAWGVVAAIVTVLHIALMRWSMPTPKGKRSVSFIPLVLGGTLMASALAKGFSLSVTLYLYASCLLAFLIGIVPVKKWVAADILKQEQNPDIKVKPHTPSLVWMLSSMLLSVFVMIGVWMSNA